MSEYAIKLKELISHVSLQDRQRRFYVIVAWLVYAVWLLFYEAVGLFVSQLPAHDLSTVIDDRIPLTAEFVWIYMLCYIFPFTSVLVSKDWHRFNRGLISIGVANLIAAACYMTLPVTIPREILGNSVSERMLSFIYHLDSQTSACNWPSLHVVFAWLTYFMCRNQKLGKLGERIILSFAIAISVSTLFVKQHILLDVISGIAIAYVAWGISTLLYPAMSKSHEEPSVALKQMVKTIAPVVIAFGVILFLFMDYQLARAFR